MGFIFMPPVYSTIACNLDENLLAAALPLFEKEQVDAIEWPFDSLYQFDHIPGWFEELLQTFATKKRLIGHGIYFSLFSGKWLPQQQTWLTHLEKVSRSFSFDHVSEHFGFMTGENFHQGAPIGIPYTNTTLAIGQDRLKRLQQACQCPVGLENLAFSYSVEEVQRHGDFLEKLIEPINGFIILDLHNLYCQSHNFEIDVDQLVQLYPLTKVREMHISGGSWEQSAVNPGKKIRRDTHDDGVPDEVFQLLEKIIPLCPNVKFVVLEQLSHALATEEERKKFQADFERMSQIVKRSAVQQSNAPGTNMHNFFQPPHILTEAPIEDTLLFEQQLALSSILESANSYEEAAILLQQSNLAHTSWHIENWQPHMLETAMAIAQKWKNGFS
jgi:uncharacterized protein